MEDFEFHTPGSLDEAVAALQGAEEGKLLAGGMSLLPVMKLDLAAPTDVVDLAGVPGLREITADESSVTIGALCTHAEVAGSDAVQTSIPALSHLVGEIGDPQ
ncbi:MAG: carbon monoxide dehydrogenase, partial [Gemmatimonadetes bacterium]|nr:carbon monoxide dehydrogenase [Gemmatimonadota bacterium]